MVTSDWSSSFESTPFGMHDSGQDDGRRIVMVRKKAFASKAENKYWEALVNISYKEKSGNLKFAFVFTVRGKNRQMEQRDAC